ncbi:MAG: tetratricopeptide repeat protein [Gammaproteobacteria bacterium]
MNKLFKELRRREVFRTAGLYVGICWLMIEVASVILPTFDAPPWILRGAFVAAIAGFPIMLVLAWFFDVTKTGIQLQADPADVEVQQSGAGKTDFAIIGVLLFALVVSVSLNLKGKEPANVATEPVSVLVAGFNSTADEPLFDHVLEEALIVALQVAPHVAIIDRRKTRGVMPAREFAHRNGIDMFVTGSVLPSDDGFEIAIEGIDLADGQSAFRLDERADSRDDVLPTIGELSATLLKNLGHSAARDPQTQHAQTFVAASLAAGHAYATARQSEMAGNLEAAEEHYLQATAADPQLGRAFANLALVQFELGKTEEAAAHWTRALSLVSTMTNAERLRALGRYASSVTLDDDEGARVYAELVAAYPVDAAARADYARALFRQLEFDSASEQMQQALKILPSDSSYRLQLALYEMYNSEWGMASKEAQQIVAADPQRTSAYLPIAMAALAQGQNDAARDAYQSMALAAQSGYGASVAELGLADLEMYLGQTGAAQQRLIAGIQTDLNSGQKRVAAAKYIALAQSYAGEENFSAATAAASDALSLADDTPLAVPAAMLFLRAGDLESAQRIAASLAQKADAHSRAYALMLKGMMLQNEGAQTEAILAMRDGIDLADLWLIRYQIGKAYLQAGSYPEALDELTTLKVRSGEATAVFLDQMPTYRLIGELPYWIDRAQKALVD